MSTKIYEAYRTTKKIDTFKLQTLVRDALVPEIKASIKHQINTFMANPQDELASFFEETMGYKPYEGKVTPIGCSDILKQLYRKDASNPHQSTWDMNLSVTFRKSGDHHYLIPYTGGFYRMWKRDMVDNVFKTLPLQEYGYWNNTDMPDNVTGKEWGQRKKVWNRFLDNWQGNYLTLEIMTPDSFFYLDPIWEEHFKKQNNE